MAEYMDQAGPLKALPGIQEHWVYKAGTVCDHVCHNLERSCYGKSKANMQRETNSGRQRMDRGKEGRKDGCCGVPCSSLQCAVHRSCALSK